MVFVCLSPPTVCLSVLALNRDRLRRCHRQLHGPLTEMPDKAELVGLGDAIDVLKKILVSILKAHSQLLLR